MMGRQERDQRQLFYEFSLDEMIPTDHLLRSRSGRSARTAKGVSSQDAQRQMQGQDHLVRKIDTALDLSWHRSELAPHYSSMGRPSIDPELVSGCWWLGISLPPRAAQSAITRPTSRTPTTRTPKPRRGRSSDQMSH